MNSLSWLLYAIDVIGNFKLLTFLALIVCGVIFGLTLFSVVFSEGDVLDDDNRPTWYKFFWRSLAGAFVAFALYAFLPSTNTMYAIAASEAGERAIKNGTVQDITSDATKALQQWIKKQIEPEQKK